MSSDVCKHCTTAPCLDVCPTGALFRTEFGTVVVQQDVCNGCGYCVPPARSASSTGARSDGRAWKCTLCYDRLKDGMEPACAKACPTESIQFGALDELRASAPGASSSCTTRAATMRACTAPIPATGSAAGRVLPAPRRARGLRAAARPGRADARSRHDLGRGRRRGGHDRARRRGCRAGAAWAGPAMSDREPLRRTWAAGRWGGERPGTPATGGPTMAQSEPVPSAPAATTPTWAGRQRGGDGREVEPRARPTSYYGRPIVKPPPWKTPLIACYLFAGGLAGASAALGAAAHVSGNRPLERRAWAASLAALAVSPPLLIADLGRPARFFNMLRVFKVTSPLNVGAWVLAATSGAVERRRRRASSPASRGGPAAPPRCPRACWARSSPHTPVACWPPRRCRPGTRRAASCRSCSPAVRWRAPARRRWS